MLCKRWFALFLGFFFGYFRKCVARSEKLVYDYGLWLGKPSPGQKTAPFATFFFFSKYKIHPRTANSRSYTVKELPLGWRARLKNFFSGQCRSRSDCTDVGPRLSDKEIVSLTSYPPPPPKKKNQSTLIQLETLI